MNTAMKNQVTEILFKTDYHLCVCGVSRSHKNKIEFGELNFIVELS